MQPICCNSNLKSTLEAAGKRPERVRFEAMQRLFDEFASHRQVRIKDGDQAGFCKYIKGMDHEGRRLCSVQYVNDEGGALLLYMGLTRDRWVPWFSTLVVTTSPALHLDNVEELKVWPSCIHLDDFPSISEVAETMEMKEK